MGTEQPFSVQREGQSQGLSRILLELIKEDFQNKFGAEFKKRDFFSSVGF